MLKVKFYSSIKSENKLSIILVSICKDNNKKNRTNNLKKENYIRTSTSS